ncbi:MAG: TonB-dependent receptor plug domain-containing protein, partial [Saprospiraceae bacterium]|nr:TonB-dependent receptor plug domain-containing protein [Saprospiraceae bacterium]
MRLLYIFLICILASAVHAQTQLAGQVLLLPDNEPAIGATIAVKGAAAGTVTDVDGKFSITLPSGATSLLVSYAGYQTQDVEVGTQKTLEIRLSESVSQLNEVVVTGYGAQKRSSISGSVSTVTAEEIAERPILRVEQALQGRTAGVQIAQNSGSPGSALTVRIRGVGTINNADPLYIVDGIPVEGLDFLNPNDIESVNVLKDAASAAIYGSRGANGVVLITTKLGSKNKDGKISYEAYVGIQRPGRLVDLLDAREYATLQNEAYVAAG